DPQPPLAVLPQPIPLGVLLIESDLVQQLIRLLDVEGGPLLPVLRPRAVAGVLGWCHRAGRPHSEPERLVQLVAVDAQCESVAEISVAQPLPDLGIGVEA